MTTYTGTIIHFIALVDSLFKSMLSSFHLWKVFLSFHHFMYCIFHNFLFNIHKISLIMWLSYIYYETHYTYVSNVSCSDVKKKKFINHAICLCMLASQTSGMVFLYTYICIYTLVTCVCFHQLLWLILVLLRIMKAVTLSIIIDLQ